MKRAATVDDYIASADHWQDELRLVTSYVKEAMRLAGDGASPTRRKGAAKG